MPEPEMHSLVYLRINNFPEHECDKFVCAICNKKVSACAQCCDLDALTAMHEKTKKPLDQLSSAVIVFVHKSGDDNPEDRVEVTLCSPECLAIVHRTGGL